MNKVAYNACYGGFNLSLDESDGKYNENEPTDERIRQFIIDKVIPLVLDG